MNPAAIKSSIGGSQFKGWRPVRRWILASRRIQLSGVSASFLSTCDSQCEEGEEGVLRPQEVERLTLFKRCTGIMCWLSESAERFHVQVARGRGI